MPPNLLAQYFYLWEPTVVWQAIETASHFADTAQAGTQEFHALAGWPTHLVEQPPAQFVLLENVAEATHRLGESHGGISPPRSQNRKSSPHGAATL
jgi:hypothetical protein